MHTLVNVSLLFAAMMAPFLCITSIKSLRLASLYSTITCTFSCVTKLMCVGVCAADSETVRDIIYQATGFDMDVTRKEDLHKEMRDKSLSAMSFYSGDDSQADDAPPPEVSAGSRAPEGMCVCTIQIACNISLSFVTLDFYCFSPQPMVPRSQYDKLMTVHRDEMESLQEEYE